MAFIGFVFIIAGVVAGLAGGLALIFVLMKTTENPSPAVLIPALAAPLIGFVGGVLLGNFVAGRVPVRCYRCGGLARSTKWSDFSAWRCSDCGMSVTPFNFSHYYSSASGRKRAFIHATSVLWRFPMIFGLGLWMYIVFLGVAGIFIAYMFLLAFVMGACANLLVRVSPQDAPENQPKPWKVYFRTMAGYLFLVLVLIAPARSVVVWGLIGDGGGSPLAKPTPIFDTIVGACGVLYGLIAFTLEGFWRFRQWQQVRLQATSSVNGAAIGLCELTGTARAIDAEGGPVIIRGRFGLFEGGQGQPLVVELAPRKFYLEDRSGRILVDPVHASVTGRRPLVGVLGSFLGKRQVELALTRHVKRTLWPNREYELRDGDQVYLIGSVEEREDAVPDATGPDRLVVRPSREGRRDDNLLEQFLFPFSRKPRRHDQDIFFLSDTSEAKARRLVVGGMFRQLLLAIVWIILSGHLLVRAAEREYEMGAGGRGVMDQIRQIGRSLSR